jgi:hypothetical protein
MNVDVQAFDEAAVFPLAMKVQLRCARTHLKRENDGSGGTLTYSEG